MVALSAFDAEIAAARKAGLSAARVAELEHAREMAREMGERLRLLPPPLAGMVMDSLPRAPVTPAGRQG